VADLAPLLGAAGFMRRSAIAKARADLTGLLYADGIHDSLYRSGGLSLVRQAWAAGSEPATRTEPAPHESQQIRAPSSR
jgi:hypothetical protein